MVDEDIVVGPGAGLKNALVRISQGISAAYPPSAVAAEIDQSDCMYRPRVVGMMAGQTLLIKNDDQTLHNVHTYRGASTMFNQAQIPGMAPMPKVLTDAGQVIKFKCDVHPWMTGYVAVSAHPFFAITGDDGSFIIDKVPPGTYTVEVWQERLGTKTEEVTVTDDKPAVLSFVLAAT